MAGLLNVGEMSALALHAMVEMAAGGDAGARSSVAEMAKALNASQHTLHKVITRLVNAGLVDSARGPSGGIKLAEAPESITVLQVVEAVDGRVDANACLFAKRICCDEAKCPFHGLAGTLEKKIRESFTRTTIRDLADTVAPSATTNEKKLKTNDHRPLPHGRGKENHKEKT